MRFTSRLARLLPGILAPWLSCASVRGQIHEEVPLPSLDEGVLVRLEKDRKTAAPDRSGKSIGTGDFSVVCRLALPAGAPAWNGSTAILQGSQEGASHDNVGPWWRLMLDANGSLAFTARVKESNEPVSIATPKGSVAWGKSHQIAVSVHRDARQPSCGISLDGVEVASGTFAPMDLRSALPAGDWDSSGFVSSVILYNRALTRTEILELQLRSSRREEAQTSGTAASSGSISNASKSAPPHVGSYAPFPKHPAPPPNGPRFIPQPDETIALIGGTEAVALAESGELEALLLMAFPNTRFHFRSLAWEGDTVFKQDRPMNFGSLEQQLRRVNAGAVFVMFGRQECLDAAQNKKEREYGSAYSPNSPATSNNEKVASGLPTHSRSFSETSLTEFKSAFEKLLVTVEKVTPNIVVLGPWPFETKPPPMPDMVAVNAKIPLYDKIMRESTEQFGAIFTALFYEADKDSGFWRLASPFPTSRSGHEQWGENWSGYSVARALDPQVNRVGSFSEPPDWENHYKAVCGQIQSKNRLWHNYWRPSNWAFLHGDRTQQPSSRDPVNPQIRFFPSEQEKYLPLIKDAEDKIYQLVQEAQKKLP